MEVVVAWVLVLIRFIIIALIRMLIFFFNLFLQQIKGPTFVSMSLQKEISSYLWQITILISIKIYLLFIVISSTNMNTTVVVSNNSVINHVDVNNLWSQTHLIFDFVVLIINIIVIYFILIFIVIIMVIVNVEVIIFLDCSEYINIASSPTISILQLILTDFKSQFTLIIFQCLLITLHIDLLLQ